MNKFILGLSAAAAIATPIAFAGTAEAADTTTSEVTACVPIPAKPAVELQSHTEYKYRRADGATAHNVAWSRLDQTSIIVDQILYNRDGNRTQTVIDVAAAPAVDAVICPTTVTFTNSKGELLAGGNAWVVAGGTWTQLGTTDSTGTLSAELAPGSYEFTMDYLGARQTQTVQVGAGGAQVDFKTASATVTFTNSKGELLAGGNAWVVAGGTWTQLGTTDSTGTLSAELAPGSYEFTMDYLGARQTQTVQVGAGGAQVDFKTASATVTFTNSKGELLAGGNAWVVAGGTWTQLGTTDSTGTLSAELAPGSYEFTMDYLGARQTQTVQVGAGGAQVDFDTYRVEVRGQVTDAAGTKTPVLTGTWYYVVNGGWHTIGTPDTNGDAITQLLPGTYTFVHVADDDTRNTFTDVTVGDSAPARKVLKFVG